MHASPAFPPALAALALAAGTAFAHPDPAALDPWAPQAPAFFLAQAETSGSPATATAPKNRVAITIEGDTRVIRSNGWPDHLPGAFPRKGNPNTARPQDYTFRVPLHPVPAAAPVNRPGWFFAVAVNGVPFEAGTAEVWNNDRSSGWHYEAHTGFLDLGLDEHNAHVQPTGAYHYHALPTGLVERLGGDGKKMLLLAWAADGFPVYSAFGHSVAKDAASPLRKMKSSFRLKSGARPAISGGPGGNYDGRFTEDWEYAAGSGDLDECNGRFGVTPEFPQGTYYYAITDEFPFLPRQWRGSPDLSFGKGGGPPMRGAGPSPGGGAQPPGAFGSFDPQQSHEGGGPGRFPPPPPVVTALDTNHDGVIDADEIAAAPAALRKLDRNGDGKLTPDELRPAGFPGGPPPDARRGPR